MVALPFAMLALNFFLPVFSPFLLLQPNVYSRVMSESSLLMPHTYFVANAAADFDLQDDIGLFKPQPNIAFSEEK